MFKSLMRMIGLGGRKEEGKRAPDAGAFKVTGMDLATGPDRSVEITTRNGKVVGAVDVTPMPKLRLKEGNTVFEAAFERAIDRQDAKNRRLELRRERRTERRSRREEKKLRPWGHSAA